MSNYARQAEKQSASVFKWVINDDVFTTKMDISNRNLRVSDQKIDTESNLKNIGKYLTEKIPQSIETSLLSSANLNLDDFNVRSTNLRTQYNHKKAGSYYGFEQFDKVALNEDRTIEKGKSGIKITELPYQREFGYPIPKKQGNPGASTKTQDYDAIIEKTAPQRGGLHTRNYVKDKTSQ